MKVKVFNFEVSNFAFNMDEEDIANSPWSHKYIKRLVSYEEVERCINDFIEDKEVTSILTNTVENSYHNNGRSNIVTLVYTICYK